jgi:branched-chain amino acid aminotransferase
VPAVYLNGKLVPENEAKISVFDHGLVTGDGVFESVVIRNGRPFALSRHLARLQSSGERIGLVVPDASELKEAVQAVVASSGFQFAKVRITVTGGPGLLGSARSSSEPTVIVAVEELPPRSPAVAVVVAPWPRNERGTLAGAKTISYAENVVALAYATSHQAQEALFLNLAGNLCEGTGTNIFVGLGGRLVTPPLSAGCLAGVTRGLVLEATGAVEADVSVEELGRVSEAFLSSTTRGVHPVARIDDRPLEVPGPLTKAAEGAFEELVRKGQP